MMQMQNASYFFINPKLGLSADLNKNVNAYASIAMANKEPNRDDFVQSNGKSRPKPEQLTDLEAGLRFKSKKILASVNVYDMEYKDQLVLNGQINNVGAYNRVNVNSSFRRGVEAELAYTPNAYIRLAGNLSLSSNKIRNFSEYIDSSYTDGYTQYKKDYQLTDISFSPSQVSSAIVTLMPLKGLEITLSEKNVGRQYLDNTSNKNRSIAPYSLLNVRLNYTIDLKSGQQIGLMFAVYNVTNTRYVTNGYTFSYYSDATLTTMNYYAPASPMNFLGGIRIGF
jgi:iron complex outermembrane receptor protein